MGGYGGFESPAETPAVFFELDPLETANPVVETEIAQQDFEGLRLHRMHRREIVLGLGFSIGLHGSVLVMAVLITLFCVPSRTPGAPFMTVSLTNLGGFGNGSQGTQHTVGDGSAGSSSSPAAAVSGRRVAHAVQRLKRVLPESRSGTDKVQEKTTMSPAIAGRQVTKPHERVRVRRKAVSHKASKRLARAHKPVTRHVAKSVGKAAASPESIACKPCSHLPAREAGKLTPEGGGKRGGNRATGKNLGGSGARLPGGALPGGEGGGTGPATLNLNQVDIPPSILRKVKPEYPQEARQMGITGRVVVKFLVKTDGSVGTATVVKARPRGIFERSVLEAIHQWRFKPARYRGHVVATWVVLPINFRLAG